VIQTLAVAPPLTERIGPGYLGVVIPLAIFVLAAVATWLLYRRFNRD
jgi:hypothetical protein